MARTHPDPVHVGYRISGVVFGLIGLAITYLAWAVIDAGWVVVGFMAVTGLGLLVPALGMLFAKTNEGAKRAASWLLLDLILPT